MNTTIMLFLAYTMGISSILCNAMCWLDLFTNVLLLVCAVGIILLSVMIDLSAIILKEIESLQNVNKVKGEKEKHE